MVQTIERDNAPTVEPDWQSLAEARLLPPPRSNRRWFIIAGVGLVVAAIAAVVAVVMTSGGGSSGSESANAGLRIHTASGTFTITDVAVGDRYPAGCVSSSPGCYMASSGSKMLVVTLTPQGQADVNDIMSGGKDAYVIASNGTRTDSFLYGWRTGAGDAKDGMVGFTPNQSDQGFTLHWPGNNPVQLGK